MTQTNPRTATGAALDHYNKTKQTVSGLTYAALACFGIEYITLFMGVTIFMRSLNLLNIVAHGTGLVLTVLLYVDNWDVSALGALFAVFNVLPTVLELSVLFLASKFAFLKY
ncbi:transmembrane protein [Haematococcus lacustris]